MYIKNRTGNGEMKKPSQLSALSRLISKVIFYVLLMGFLGVSAYMFFFSNCLQISEINISGNDELSDSDIQKSFDNYLQGKFLGVIPKNNFLFISQKRIADFLGNDFRKIRSVTVSKKFPNSVSINIEERKAVLVWCSGENCFLIDEKGIAYNNADFNSPEIVQNHLIRINDSSPRDTSIGEKITEPVFENYAINMRDALEGVGLKISGDSDAYLTPSNVANEINVKTDKNVWIYFSTQFPLNSATDTLNIILKKEITEDKLEDIEYIDLRSEGKVFYKFKEKETEKNENSENKSE